MNLTVQMANIIQKEVYNKSKLMLVISLKAFIFTKHTRSICVDAVTGRVLILAAAI